MRVCEWHGGRMRETDSLPDESLPCNYFCCPNMVRCSFLIRNKLLISKITHGTDKYKKFKRKWLSVMIHDWTRWIISNYIIRISYIIITVCLSVHPSTHLFFPKKFSLQRDVFHAAIPSSNLKLGDVMEDIRSQHGTGALTWQTLYQWQAGQEVAGNANTAPRPASVYPSDRISIATWWKLELKSSKFAFICQLL